ncbi:MAG: sigma-54-dependent Fis family transcriptional regulator [Planctomycetota bacterium]|nr:sigma-54-dependent Fis family transcriptional regulator [Planctomycetota bacterium]
MPKNATLAANPGISAPGTLTNSPSSQPALDLLWRAAQSSDGREFAKDALAVLLPVFSAGYAALLRLDRGHWLTMAELGSSRAVPRELLAEALDREEPVAQQQWLAAPVDSRSVNSEVLVIQQGSSGISKKDSAELLEQFRSIATVLATGLAAVRARESARRRIEQLEAILSLAAQWNQTHELEPLLEQMAAASTRLLNADRASIFLWDRSNRTLVGRPALGAPNNELRIPDDAGIVGQVVQSQQPRRVQSADRGEQSQINRQVDAKLGYETRSLLCVPLQTAQGEMLGAFELINKLSGEFTNEDETALIELAAHAATALANTQQLEDLVATQRQMVDQAAGDVHMIGKSNSIVAMQSIVRRVAATDLAVLILGENGTGKEVVSRSIHYLSARRNKPFIAVNCAAIAETLLESELFGHEKGAFTDAHEARAGKFELANGGTLFLDEIGDLSRGGQAKLLRVLEEKIVVRVGGSVPIHTDARVIAATNQNLAEMVREKRFREDLYFRLNVVTMELPPLRQRGDDVLLLAEHFLSDFCKRARRKVPKFTPAARKRLEQHNWPGNVRELRNLMERLAYLSSGDKIEAEELAFIMSPGQSGSSLLVCDGPLTDATERFQQQYIKKAIERTRGNMTDAAALLGLHRSNLYRKMRQLEMDVEEE